MADRIEDFLVCGDGVLELSGHMEFMPAWMGLALKAAGQDSIRVHKVQDMVEVEPALPDFKARLAGIRQYRFDLQRFPGYGNPGTGVRCRGRDGGSGGFWVHAEGHRRIGYGTDRDIQQ